MSWFDIHCTLTRAARDIIAAMPRHEMDGNSSPSPQHFFFETPEAETGSFFFDDDNPLLDTDDDDDDDDTMIQ